MGDCFAYACSRTNGARLLFKGGDFAKTDIVPAFRSE
jgi:ribonuclease VapC